MEYDATQPRAHMPLHYGRDETMVRMRDVVEMTGTKFGCGMALCGACTVHLDGRAIRSCVTPVGVVGRQPIANSSEWRVAVHVGRGLPDCSAIMYAAYQLGQSASRCGLLCSASLQLDRDPVRWMPSLSHTE
jgi:isoquinoline 1-oxidoreductase subunit alpha